MENPDFTTRPAEKPDAAALLDMIARLASHHGNTPSITPETLDADLFSEPAWISALVAQDRSQALIGYAIVCPLYRAQYGHRGLDLHHLFVMEDRRGQGVGKALVLAAIAEARRLRCRYFTIGATPDNLAAHRYYENLGFVRTPLSGERFTLVLDGKAPE